MSVSLEGIEYVYEPEKKNLDYFISKVNKENKKLINFFNFKIDNVKMFFMTKEELDEFLKNTVIGKQKTVERWIVGFTIDKNIYIVYPHKENVEYMIRVALHELVHCYTNTLNVKSYKIPLILKEGIAKYLSGQVIKDNVNILIQDYREQTIPKLAQLCSDNKKEMILEKIYVYSGYFVNFLIETRGKHVVLDYLYNNIDLFDDILLYENDFFEYCNKFAIENMS